MNLLNSGFLLVIDSHRVTKFSQSCMYINLYLKIKINCITRYMDFQSIHTSQNKIVVGQAIISIKFLCTSKVEILADGIGNG